MRKFLAKTDTTKT